MLRIGFATEFYTLWDVDTTPNFFTDSYGNSYIQSYTTHYHYMKNVSKDLAIVTEKYPNVTVDEDLRGKTSSWKVQSKEDLVPHILKFGKYFGMHIADVAKKEFGYILWLIENTSKVVADLCKELPEVIEYYKQRDMDRQTKMDAHPVAESGVINVMFENNPNYKGYDLNYIQRSFKYNFPATIEWIEGGESIGKGYNTLLSAENGLYRIIENLNTNDILFSGSTYPTIDAAKTAAEEQKVVNKHGNFEDYLIEDEMSLLRNKYCAVATIGTGNKIFIFFDDIKAVNGRYPYNMGVINGKPKRVKGKTLTLDLNIIKTIKDEYCATQFATIKK